MTRILMLALLLTVVPGCVSEAQKTTTLNVVAAATELFCSQADYNDEVMMRACAGILAAVKQRPALVSDAVVVVPAVAP